MIVVRISHIMPTILLRPLRSTTVGIRFSVGHCVSVGAKKKRRGEYVFCQLPDGTISSLPAWMFSPECAQLSLGSPLIAVEALLQLRDLLNALQVPSGCDKASLKPSLKGGSK